MSASPDAAPQDPTASMFTALLQDPGFQKLSPDARAEALRQKIASTRAELQQKQQAPLAFEPAAAPTPAVADADFTKSLSKQTTGPTGLARLPQDKPLTATKLAVSPKPGAAHALDAVLSQPNGDIEAALKQYVYGP